MKSRLCLSILAWGVSTASLGAQTLINVEFGAGSHSLKTGFAATGQSTNDAWNLFRLYDPKYVPGAPLVFSGRMAGLKEAGGAPTDAAMDVTNAPGVWGNATGDPMYDSYVFAPNGSNIIVTLSRLEPGSYDFYLYGHADPDASGEQNSFFKITSAGTNYGPLSTLSSAGWKAGMPWAEGRQFVVFRDLQVQAGAPVVIEVAPGPNGVAVLNGLQISSKGTSPPKLTQRAPVKGSAGFTNLVIREIRYAGKVNDSQARFTADLQVESFTTNELTVPLFQGDVAVEAQSWPDHVRLTRAGDRCDLSIGAPGLYNIKMEVLAKITRAEPWNQIDFQGPAAAIASIHAEATGQGVEMQLLSGTALENGKDSSSLEGFLSAGREVSLRWKSKTAEVARHALIEVDTAAEAQATPAVVRLKTTLRYELLQASVPRLRLLLPANQALTRLQGEEIRDWRIEQDGARQILDIEFIKPVEKNYQLVLYSEQAMTAMPAQVQLTAPQPLEADRETGSFTLSAADTLVDVGEISGLRRVNAAGGALAAFRFFARPFSLAATVRRVEPVLTVADRATARLEESRLLVVHALDLTVEKAGLYAVEFATPPNFSVVSVKGQDVEDWKAEGGALRVNFASLALGERPLEVELEQALKTFPSQIEVAPLRAAGAARQTAQIGVAAAPGLRVKTAEINGLREIPAAQFPGHAGEVLAFSANQADWLMKLSTERLPARIGADIFNLITIGDGVLGGSATIRYDLVNQGVQEFHLKVPSAWKNVEFTGVNIRSREQNGEDWTIRLQEKAWDGYTLVVTYDEQFDASNAILNAAGLHAPEAEHETGSLAITTAASLKVQPGPVAEPLRVIDRTELAQSDRALVTHPILLAYRYTGHSYDLKLNVARQQETAVLDAVSDRAQLTSVLTDAGEMLTQASFMVKNNGKQFQRFQLPPGARFWGCNVDGKTSKAEQDKDWLLAPLPEHADRDQAFAVDIVYAQDAGPVKSRWIPEKVALQAPRTDLPNTFADWVLFVPDACHLSSFGGTMKAVRGATYGLRDAWSRFTGFYSDLWDEHATALFWAGVACLAIILAAARMRSTGARGWIAIMALAAILAILAGMMLPALGRAKQKTQRLSSVDGSFAAKPLSGEANAPTAPASAAAPALLPASAGLRSIHIDIPRQGRPFAFTKVLNTGGEPLSVTMSVMNARTFAFARSGLQVTAFLLGCLLVWWQWRHNRGSFMMTLGAALALGAVGALLITGRVLHVAFIAAVPLAVLAALIWLILKIRPRKAAAPAPEASSALPPLAASIVLFLMPAGSVRAQTAPPPSLSSASYIGVITGHVAQFEATLRLFSYATNQTAPLFGDEVALEDFTAQSGGAKLLRQNGQVSLLLPEAGETSVKLKFVVPLGGDVSKRQLSFAIPSALASQLSATIDEPDADVEFPAAVAFERATAGQQTRITATIGSAGRVEIQWTPRVKRAAEVAATIFVENNSLADFADGVMDVRSTLNYQITQGELRQARARLPAGQRLLRVDGDFIRTWQLEGDVLVVDLLKGVSPAYTLTVETEKTLEALPAAGELEIPRALEVRREAGLVAVRASDDLSLSVERAENLQRVDPSEFKPRDTNLFSVWRFLNPGFTLAVRAQTVQPQIESLVQDNVRIGAAETTLSALINDNIKRAGVFALQFALPAGYALTDVTGDNIQQWQTRQNGSNALLEVSFKNRIMGACSLRLDFARPRSELPPSLAIPGVQPLNVAKFSGFISVATDSGVAAKTANFDGLTEIPASTLGGAATAAPGVLAYQFLGPEWKLEVTLEKIDSWVRAEIGQTVFMSDNLLHGSAIVHYDIQNAPVKKFRFKIPAAYTNVEINCPNIRRRDQTGQEWSVELQNAVHGQFALSVTWEKRVNGDTNTLELPGIQALGVERESGYVAVHGKRDLQITEKTASAELSKIDAGELPSWVGSWDGPALAWRYVRPGYVLSVETRRFADAAVLEALADQVRLTTVVAQDGQAMTLLALSVRNNGLQHLEIQLPANSTVWSAFVGGEAVRPALSKGKLLLPLETAGAQGDAPVSIELTYIGSEKFPKGRGQVKLVSPQLGAPLKNTRWDLYLPPDYDYDGFAGSMTHEAQTAPTVQSYSLSEYKAQEAAEKENKEIAAKDFISTARRKLAMGDVLGINRRSSFDNNAIGGSAQSQSDIRALQDELERIQAGNLSQQQRVYRSASNASNAQSPANSPEELTARDQWNKLAQAQEMAVAQARPLRVNLPINGLHEAFTQVLQTETAKPLTIQFMAANLQSGGLARNFILGLLAFLLLWVIVKATVPRPPSHRAA